MNNNLAVAIVLSVGGAVLGTGVHQAQGPPQGAAIDRRQVEKISPERIKKVIPDPPGVVTDPATGLFWLKNANCFGEKNWDQARLAAQNLKSGECGLYDGSKAGQWRLPTRQELEQWRNHTDARAGCQNVRWDMYWTVTPGEVNFTHYAVDFTSLYAAVVSSGTGNSYYVWPVREYQPGLEAGAKSVTGSARTTPLKVLPRAAHVTTYTWTFPQIPVKMLPVNAGLCALTGLAGTFRGGGEAVWITQYAGYWALGGQSQQGYTWAQAHCVPYGDFAGEFTEVRSGNTSGWLGCTTSTCPQSTVVRPYQNNPCRAVFLQGISGDFERPSMWRAPALSTGRVSWQSGSYTYSGVGVSAQGRGIQNESQAFVYATMQGLAGCLNGPGVPVMQDQDSGVTYKRGEFRTAPAPDVKTGYLANSHFCTIGSVFGYFHGGGERVNLAIDASGEWVIQGQTMQEYTGLSAWCFRYR